MDWIEIILKIIVPIVTVLSIALNIDQYLRSKKISRFDAEKKLAKIKIELDRLGKKHKQESRHLFNGCEGEIRERGNIIVDTLTEKDARRLTELHEEQRREWNELIVEMTYFQKILGQDSEFLLYKDKSMWGKLKWRINILWRNLKK
jgi:hypothetical protein